MATRSTKSKAPPRSTKTKAIKPAAVPKRKAGGRPPAYSQAFDDLAHNLALLGLTNQEMIRKIMFPRGAIGYYVPRMP